MPFRHATLICALALLASTVTAAQKPAPQLGIPIGETIRVQSGIRRIGTVTGVALGLTADTIRLTATDKSGIGAIPLTAKVRLQIKSDSGWRDGVLTGARIRVTDSDGSRLRIGTLQLREADQLFRSEGSDSVEQISRDAHVEISEGMVAGPIRERNVIAGLLIGGLLGAVMPVEKQCGAIFGCVSQRSNIVSFAIAGAGLGTRIGRSETEKWRAVKR